MCLLDSSSLSSQRPATYGFIIFSVNSLSLYIPIIMSLKLSGKGFSISNFNLPYLSTILITLSSFDKPKIPLSLIITPACTGPIVFLSLNNWLTISLIWPIEVVLSYCLNSPSEFFTKDLHSFTITSIIFPVSLS